MKQDGLKKTFVHTMQEKIFSGEYRVGQQLPAERELAAKLGISRSLVNSGILELANQGFVHIIPRRGSIVADYKRSGTLPVLGALMNNESCHLDYSLFCDLTDLHVLVESECARLACQIASPDELSTLRALVDEIRAAKQPVDATDPIFRFHRTLVQSSGNSVYLMTFNSFESVIYRLLRQQLALAPDIPEAVTLHDSLVRSLEARDPEASAKNIRLCILQTSNALKKLYRA
jgi:DNA-binding FadR family transcriptional regulator